MSIKFKAKRKDNNEWMTSLSIKNFTDSKWENLQGKVFLLEEGLSAKWIEVIPETVCQFTGLTDKNGKEIFKSDLLVDLKEYPNRNRCEPVEYNNGGFVCECSGWGEMNLSSIDSDNIEITGNKHD